VRAFVLQFVLVSEYFSRGKTIETSAPQMKRMTAGPSVVPRDVYLTFGRRIHC